MPTTRSSTVDHEPDDAIGDAVAETIVEILQGASVETIYSPVGQPMPPEPTERGVAVASGMGPPGWRATLVVRLGGRLAALLTPDSTRLTEILAALPGAGLRTAARFRPLGESPEPPTPALRRAVRDTLVIEMLSHHQAVWSDRPAPVGLIAETIEFLIELSGLRVESHDLTHGVVITDVFTDTPRLRFDYPADLRAAKRGPLLFDGQRSLLLVDREGRARFELQHHRFSHVVGGTSGEEASEAGADDFVEAGSFVSEATKRLGGLGFFLRADRTIWAFAEGQPLMMRRGEHWTAFPLELATFVANMIDDGPAADIVVQAAFIISAQRHGAILAIVNDVSSLDTVVSSKDRYDLRDEFDPMAMRTETRLHHLIDAEDLDAQTLARLATLDGATVVDRNAQLIAYGAIVTSSDSQHEGARTAAAKSLSETADVVLKVSVDGDITVFRRGDVIATLLDPGPNG